MEGAERRDAHIIILLGRMDVLGELDIEFREREEKVVFRHPLTEQ